MGRLFADRRLGIIGLFVVLVGIVLLPQVYAADAPCFDKVNEVACPTLGPTGTCEQQGENVPPDSVIDCMQGILEYNSRTSGPYQCGTNPVETYVRCVPEKNAEGEVVTEKCGQRYRCEWDSAKWKCVKSYAIGQPYYADKYTTTKIGCKQPPP